MRILHTSDWHLGKNLEDYSRIMEQELFISELITISDENNIDMILISGDIFDSYNPPAKAEKLFYNALNKLSKNGKRPVVIIAGNHDNPERLSASYPLALESGIIISANLKTVIDKKKFDNFEIINSGEGFIEIDIKGERAVILLISYVNEKRLNEIIFTSDLDTENQKSYSDKITEIVNNLSINFREDTINIIMGHFYIVGGEMGDSERDISLGGSFSVNSEFIPKNTHYVAMGHLHRPQKVAKPPIKEAYYSGSPIQYDKGEILTPKSVLICDLSPNSTGKAQKIYLKNYKPIEIFKAESIEDALKMCEERKDENCYVYLQIKTDRVLLPSEIKALKTLKKDIVEINPIFENEEIYDFETEESSYKTIQEEFKDFYVYHRKVEAKEELIKLFVEISNDVEEEF